MMETIIFCDEKFREKKNDEILVFEMMITKFFFWYSNKLEMATFVFEMMMTIQLFFDDDDEHSTIW